MTLKIRCRPSILRGLSLFVPLVLLLVAWIFFGSSSPLGEPSGASNQQRSEGREKSGSARSSTQLPARMGEERTQAQQGRFRVANERKRSWVGPTLPTDFLDQISSEGSVEFTLPDSSPLRGTVTSSGSESDGCKYLQGRITEPRAGSFFFQKQSSEGVAGPMVGHVRFDQGSEAWKIEATEDGKSARFVLRDIDEVVCVDYRQDWLIQAMGEAGPDDGEIAYLPEDHPSNIPNPPYQSVISLQSLPGAVGVLYLDFDGEQGPFTGWGTFDAAPSGASNAEIFDIWRRVCEDFQGFNLNVTTDRAVFDAAPAGRRQQIIITPTTDAAPGAGGVAYVGSFNWSASRPCWGFYTRGKSAAEVISHELGHTLSLSHDGRTSPSEEYYGGHGSGQVAWAPIMGLGYYNNLTQWSKGEYLNANRSQDDLAIIVGNNSVDYRADDSGDALATARYLDVLPDNRVVNEGIIERTGDIDAFRFESTGGQVTLNANVVAAGPNLDLLAEIVDANTLAVIAQNNPDTGLNASVSANLAAGEYLFRVRGTGRGDPLGTGYTNYASLGSYTISGTVSGVVRADRFNIAENSSNGTAIGTIAPRNNHGGQALNFQISSGNTNGALAIDPSSGLITVADTNQLDYETLSSRWDDPAEFEIFVSVTNAADPSLNESIRTVIAVTDVNETPVMPTLNPQVFLPNLEPGTSLLTISVSDEDRFQYPVLTISSGNEAGYFSLDSQSGVLSVARSPIASGEYELVLSATDQGSPPQTSSSTLRITVLDVPDGLQPGSIVRSFYDGIFGSSISDLTRSSKFPQNPDSQQILENFDGGSYGDVYGSTIRGYVIAPATGTYRFWIASDDAGQLLLNPSGTDPAGASQIASVSGWTSRYAWTTTPSQQSAAINLTEGEAYYIEARHKEGAGDDHVAVAWTTPIDSERKVISGIYLAPFIPNYPPSITSSSFSVRENAIAGQVIGRVAATDLNEGDQLSNFTITGGNSDGIFGIEPDTGDLFVAKSGVLNRATNASYTLSIRVSDDGEPVLNGSGTVTVNLIDGELIGSGDLIQQVWTGISGNLVSLLKENANYPYNPSYTRTLSSGFDSGTRIADSYGSRVRAYLIPPTTGTYRLYLCTDDDGELWFNTSGEAAGASLVASISNENYADSLQWDKFPSQQSVEFNLTAGVKYYIEAIQKEGGGGDHLQVGWTGPGVASPEVIPATALEPYNINEAPVFDAASYSFEVDGSLPVGSLVGSLSATDPEGESVVYAILEGDPDGAFAIDASGRITIADPALLAGGSMTLTIAAQDSGIGGVYPYAAGIASVSLEVSGAVNQLEAPIASPPGGSYVGPVDVEFRAAAGVSIRYTLDGSDPRSSATAQTILSPLNIQLSGSEITQIQAYALQEGSVDSPVTNEEYRIVSADGLTWTNPEGGAWTTTANWLYGLVADGADLTARFDTLALSADRVVTLDGSRTIGGLRFGDSSGQFSWTLAPGNNGSLQLEAASTPLIHVEDGHTAIISAPLNGTNGLQKSGFGSLVLSGSNLYSGGTDLVAGTLFGTNRDAFGSGAIRLGAGSDDVKLVLGNRVDISNRIEVDGSGTGKVVIGADNSGSGLDPARYLGPLTLNRPVTILSEVSEDRLAIDGQISGQVGLLTIGGVSRTTLANSGNDFVGDILVTGNGAILQASVANAGETIPDTCDVTIDAGATLQLAALDNGVETIAGLNGAGRVRTYPDQSFGSRLVVGFGDANGSFSGSLVDGFSPLGLSKIGNGTQILSGNSLNTGDFIVSQGTLQIDGSVAAPQTQVQAGASLSGNGSIAGSMSLAGQLDPSGTLSIGQNLTLAANAEILWDLNSWDSENGQSNDLITADSVNLAADSQDPVVIRIRAADDSGFSETNRQFTVIESTAGITNFNADHFLIDTSLWALPEGVWQIEQIEGRLVLSYQRLNLKPEFTVSPLRIEALQDSTLSADLNDYLSDPDLGDSSFFVKVSGPAWLELASNGSLTGTPAAKDVGTNVFVVRATDSGGLSTEGNLEINVTAVTEDQNNNGIIDSWELEWFGGPISPGENPADGDPDGDGLPNMVEFALDKNPLRADPNPLEFSMVPISDSYHLRVTISKNPLATNLAFQLETASNPGGPWSSDLTTDIEIIEETNSSLTVQDRTPASRAQQRFMRLKVQAKP